MRRLPSSFAVKALITALFLWVQGAALFDGAVHGEQPHKHYGVSCELHNVSSEVAPLPVTPQLPTPPRYFARVEPPAFDYRPWSHPPGRAPPPRSPPVLNQ